MKKIRYFVLTVTLVLSVALSACGMPIESENATPTTQPQGEQTNISTSIYLLQNGYPLGSSSDSGYYYLQYRDDAAINICYIDYASKQQLILCNQPNCLHNSDMCNAWMPYTGSTAGIYEIDGKLYIIHYGSLTTNDYKLFGEAAAPNIEVRNADGTNASTLLQLPTNSYFTGNFATDGNYLYGMLKEIQSSESENTNAVTKLVKISLQDGNLETINEMTQMEPSIVGASGCFLVLSYYQVDSTSDSMLPSSLCYESYDTTNGKSVPLYTFSRADGTCICVGDNLFYIDKATHEVKSYAIQTGSEQILYTLSLDDYSDLYCSYALPDSIVLLLYPKDADSNVVHAILFVDTGELLEITQPMSSDETSNGKTQMIEIAAENGDEFLVISGIHYQNVSFQTSNAESIAMPTAYYEFSTIKRSDFLNNIDNFTRITSLTN